MPRYPKPYSLIVRESGYWYYKTPGMKYYRTTKTKNDDAALRFVMAQLTKPPDAVEMELDEASLKSWASARWREMDPKERMAILFTVYRGRCHYCGDRVRLSGWRDVKRNERATLDHRIPLVGGGPDTFENAVLSCQGCNSRKGPKSYELFRRELAVPGPSEVQTDCR